jgi:hypothetical protein
MTVPCFIFDIDGTVADCAHRGNRLLVRRRHGLGLMGGRNVE